ncbi:hypothetical protein FHE74_05455 [Corynebacterium tapiri]|uniref:Phosphoribosyltransferase domain-containing protein n=1 Tax=Corynebacterium tapiri TaxID=1448266 RepID=A0A5C4U3R4_9CORY|nr:hypothetical protein FHE74_05455 [Corynebacterium tapiri]
MNDDGVRVTSTQLLGPDDVARTVARIAHQIIEKTAVDTKPTQRVVLLGIPSGGVLLAHRLSHKIEEFSGVKIPVGSLDITLYRDDQSSGARSRGSTSPRKSPRTTSSSPTPSWRPSTASTASTPRCARSPTLWHCVRRFSTERSTSSQLITPSPECLAWRLPLPSSPTSLSAPAWRTGVSWPR